MPQTPTLTKELADEITQVALKQLEVSRTYKQPRMQEIIENEELYLGVTKKQYKNPFNHNMPFMSGFVDHYVSKIDDPPDIEFGEEDEADYKLAKKSTAAWKKESRAPLKHQKWAYKDRAAKTFAVFSGRGIYDIYAESDPHYRSVFDAIDHYDFHCEPDGGGILENHLFTGQDNVFMTKEDLAEGAQNNIFDAMQVNELINSQSSQDYKESEDTFQNKVARHRALKLDPVTNNYVGQDIFKLVRWQMKYKGVRWYLLFDERLRKWVRIKPLKEVVGSDLYPYVSWATHENASLFWSKGPADDARPIHKYITKAVNQELYNREKQNLGQRAYDPKMFKNVQLLSSWRPDGLVPFDSKNGTRDIRSGIYQFNVAGLNGTIDLVQFLDSYTGQKTGSTPSSQGAAEKDKKVGIFFGELQQVDEFIGTKNKSYTEAWEEIGLRYLHGLDEFLTDEGMSVRLMGPGGIEWSTLTRSDLKRNRDLSVSIIGGSRDVEKNEIEKQRKIEALKAVQSTNPQWRDREILKNAGYDDDEIKDAFSMLPAASAELMSEAAQAIKDIMKGREVKLNRGANSAFMQKILDAATDLTMKDKEREDEIRERLMDYAIAHAEIATENEARNARDFLRKQMIAGPEAGLPGAQGGAPSPFPVDRPAPAANPNNATTI